jgi:hypothetical protein
VAKAACEILFAPGTWTTGATTVRYTVRRGHTVVARGARRMTGRRLVVRLARHLRPGRYTVTIAGDRHTRALRRTVTVR